MTTYQGPHASVLQQFVPTPAAVAIEDLPSVVVATAFDVFAKEVMGSSYGIIDNDIEWIAEKVIYDKDVIDQKAYDFYPVVVYAETPFGDIELEMGTDPADVTSSGVTVGMDDAYKIPNTEKVAGSCEGIIPYYKQEGSGGDVQILSGDLSTIIISNGYVVTAGIRPGQLVLINISSTWTPVGVVGAVGNDETRVKLATAYSAPIDTTGEGIIIGAASAALKDIPDTVYDPTSDFITARVRVGDVVKLSTNTIPDSIATPLEATVVAVLNKNTLRFNTEPLTAGLEDSNFLKYKKFEETPASTLVLYTYWVERFVGFSQNYKFKTQDGNTGVQVTRVSATSLTYPQEKPTGGSPVATPILKVGDLFMLTENASPPPLGSDDRLLANNLSRVTNIVASGIDWLVTTDEEIFRVDGADFASTDHLSAWEPKLESDIKVDFRAIREEELGVVKRITSPKDIADAWTNDGEISVHNELAFMATVIAGKNGGTVFYGVNVDASADNIAAEYSEALEALKLKDVYSHAFGTTDGGVNAIVGPYCDQQSEPYEGHERIGTICYDEDDVYLMGSDGCTVAITGIITIDGILDMLSAGITVGDVAKIYDDDTILVATATVTETPDPGSPTLVQTDYDGAILGAGHSVRFLSGRKDDQAIRIGNIKYGNRRVKTIWPGWFTAEFGGTLYTLPPYYIAAAIVGNDSAIGVAQSFTNMTFSIPGLSNISLNTNHYFKKLDLDEIGAGGIDIMVQDSSVSQSIKSRHDLTSNMDAVLYREHSITKQADVAAKTIRASVAPYVGKYNITKELFNFMGQVIGIVVAKLLREGILADLSTKSIDRDEIIVDKINIVMEATVFVAGNYYDITLIVKSS